MGVLFVFLLISTENVGIIGYKECDFMAITKKMKMEYFRVVCRKKNSKKDELDILFDLTKWIEKIDKIELSSTKMIKQD